MLRTEEQRAAICTGCPMSKTIDLIGDSQLLLIVKGLLGGPMRFGDVVSMLPGVSTRTVTNKLKAIVAEGLAEKDASGSYALTKKGKGLKKVLDAMRAYGDAHLS